MASSREQMAKLARAPLGVKIGILVGVLILVFGGYYYLFYSGMSEELDTLLAQRRKLADQEKQLQQRKKEYVQLLQEKQELEEALRRNAVKLPQDPELAAFLRHLQTQSLAANVELKKLSRENERPVDSYIKVPVKMDIRGDFYSVMKFFKLLGDTPRIITVENLTIRLPPNNVDGRLDVGFTASTFRQPESAVPGEPGPGPGGAP